MIASKRLDGSEDREMKISKEDDASLPTQRRFSDSTETVGDNENLAWPHIPRPHLHRTQVSRFYAFLVYFAALNSLLPWTVPW